jgi:uncharacterized phage protein (TIGR01671 family)
MMNREILFRAKVKWPKRLVFSELMKEGTWVFGEPHTECMTPHIHYKPFKKQPIDVNTLGQHTGLFDKNGVGIYDDDIVQVSTDPLSSNKSLLIVVWNRGMARYEYRESNQNQFLLPNDVVEVEVVGNIYDNPELMKGGDQ